MPSAQLALLQIDEQGESELLAKKAERPEGVCFFGVDYGAQGKRVAVVRLDDPKENYMQKDRFLSLDFARSGDYVIIENAHVVPQNTTASLAQPFTYEELRQLKETSLRKNINIKLWPQSQTYKYRHVLYGNDSDKTDHNDAHAVVYGAVEHHVDSLQNFEPKPPGVWSDFQKWCFKQRKEMSELLNLYRIHHKFDEAPCLREFERTAIGIQMLLNRCKDSGASDARTWFGGDNLRAGGKTSTPLALWVSLVDWNGLPRRYRSNQDLGINATMRELIVNKPMHFRGGVCRSNIWFWGFKKVCNELDIPQGVLRDHSSQDYLRLQDAKRRYRQAMKLTLKLMRKAHYEKSGGRFT